MSLIKIPTPSVIERAPGLLTLQYINDPDILGYRVRVADSLDNAYGTANGVVGAGTEALFDLRRDEASRSKAIRVRGLGISGDTTRGQTRHVYDPNEYFNPPTTTVVPPDNQLQFVRTQVRTVASPVFPATADNTNQSKILIVQDPSFFSVPRPALSLYGTAPDIGAVPGLPAPPEAMVFAVPAFADAMVITNHGAAPLFFSAGLGQPLMQIDAGTNITHASGMKDELVICADGANPTFSILISTVTGDR